MLLLSVNLEKITSINQQITVECLGGCDWLFHWFIEVIFQS